MGRDIRIVTEAELRAAVGLDIATLEAVERALADLAGAAAAVLPSLLALDFAAAGGEVDVTTAPVPGRASFVLAATSGFPQNRAIGLPRHGGLMVQLSARTGQVEAVLLDNGYLSALGSAATGAIAARHLAPPDVTTAGVIGTGLLARLHLRAAHLVCPYARALVWDRDPSLAADCAVALAAQLGIEVEVTTDPRAVVKRSQLVVTVASAGAGPVRPDWLHKELHLTVAGPHRPGRTEILPDALARADVFVCDLPGQRDTAAAPAPGASDGEPPPGLVDILTGAHPGRRSPADITICDLIATATLDSRVAAHAIARLGDAGIVIRA